MLKGLATLLLFQLLGESVAFTTALPIPGPVLGLLFLLIFLRFRNPLSQQDDIEKAANGLLANLGLFFVPAGVGIIALFGVVQRELVPIAIILVASAIVTLISSVWIFILVRRLVEGRGQQT